MNYDFNTIYLLFITADNIQGATSHMRKYVDARGLPAVGLDKGFDVLDANDTLFVKNIDETVEDLEMKGRGEETSAILPPFTGR